MQEDVYQGDGLNLYAYCSNNPVVYYDPSGYKKGSNSGCPPASNNGGDGGAPEAEGSGSYTSQNQMQKQVEKGTAPKGIDRVDKPHTDTGQPHIHFGENDRALNLDGTWHDAGKNIPKVTGAIKKWILKNGWSLPNE